MAESYYLLLHLECQTRWIMTKEQFENSQDKSDMIIIGENISLAEYVFTNNGTNVYYSIVINGKEYRYTPYRLFQLYLTYFGYKSDNERDKGKQLQILTDGRSNLMQLIENLKREIGLRQKPTAVELDGFIKQIDALVEMSRANLNSEIFKRQNRTNNFNIVLLLLSIGVAGLSAYAAIKTANNEDADKLLKSQLNIEKQQNILLKVGEINQERIIDSLYILLLKKSGNTPQE